MKNIYEMNMEEILDEYKASRKLKDALFTRSRMNFKIKDIIALYNRIIIGYSYTHLTVKELEEFINILENIKNDYGIEYHRVINEELTYESSMLSVMILYDIDTALYRIIRYSTGNIENKHLKRRDIDIPTINDLIELYYLYINNKIHLKGIGEKRRYHWDTLMQDLKRDYGLDWEERATYLINLRECRFTNKGCIKESCNGCEVYNEHNIFKVKLVRG